MMLVIGVTGQIASGKSVVAREFARFGAVVISGDEIGKEVVEKNPQILDKLVGAFGSTILNRRRRLDRRALGKVAFSSPELTDKLNRIVHPPLLRKLRNEISRHKKACKKPMIVVDAALIFEWGLEKELDKVIVVESRRADQIKRLEKSGLSRLEIRSRLCRQMPKHRQRALADFVLRNDGTAAELQAAVRKLFSPICAEF